MGRDMDEQPLAKGEFHKETREIKRGVHGLEQSSAELARGADRRTVLSADRTLLAAERTYAAWVRTALAALASGIGATALTRGVLPTWIGKASGSVLVIFAGFCLVAAVWRQLSGVEPLKHPDIRPMPKALLVPINSFLLLIVIAALAGIWLS
jgi:putative membrane protein